MGRVQQRAGGGLSRADMAKLVPNNIRQGIVLFEGTAKEVTGTAVILEPSIHLADYGVTFSAGTGSSGNGASQISGTAIASTSPAFDVTSYKNATFIGCNLVSINGWDIVPQSYSCQILKDGTVVAQQSGANMSIDIKNINGYVTFRFVATFTIGGNKAGWQNNYVIGRSSFTNVCLSR